MGPDRVVVLAPRLHDGLSLGDAVEPVLVQALVPERPVETFDVGVLHRLAGLDEMQAHAALIGPGVQGLPGELRPIVHHDRLRRPSNADYLL